jgi:hypothetical protein
VPIKDTLKNGICNKIKCFIIQRPYSLHLVFLISYSVTSHLVLVDSTNKLAYLMLHLARLVNISLEQMCPSKTHLKMAYVSKINVLSPIGHIHSNSFSFRNTNGPIKLWCYITLGIGRHYKHTSLAPLG